MAARDFMVLFGGKVDPSLKSAAAATRGEVGSIGKEAEQTGSRGSKAGNVLKGALSGAGKVLGGVAVAAGAAGAAVAGISLAKGFERLTGIENARASLAGLGHEAAGVDAIMNDALASVKGTAFGMDEAAKTAASAVAAGVKPGQDLTRTLKLVGDAATIGGASMGEMGSIFNKVATSGKAQNDTLNQLADRGIPIFKLLADEMGVAESEVSKLARDGKINFDIFRNAIEKGMGGAALKSGETTVGALANVNAALGRLGAGALEGVFPLLAPLFGEAIVVVDGLTERLGPLMQRLNDTLGPKLASLIDGSGQKFLNFLDRLTSGNFSLGIDFSGFTDAAARLGPAMGKIFAGMGGGQSAASGLQTVLDGLAGGMSWVANNADTIAKVLPFVVAGMLAFGGAAKAASVANQAFGQDSAWRTAALFSLAAANTANALATRASTAATAQDTVATNVNAATKLRAVAGTVAHKAAMIATSVATKAVTAAQWLLNAALTANPIGIIVVAIAALVGGLILAYKHSETFRNIVNGIGGAIMSFLKPALDWVTGTALPALGTFVAWVGQKFMEWQPQIQAAAQFLIQPIQAAIGAIGFIITAFVASAKALWAMFGTDVLAIVGGLWSGLQAWFSGGVAVLTGIIAMFKAIFTGDWQGMSAAANQIAAGLWQMLGGLFTAGSALLTGILSMLGTAVGAIWTGIRDFAVGRATELKDWVVQRFDDLRNGAINMFGRMVDGIRAVWDGLKAAAAAPVRFVIDTVINNGIIKGWNDLAGLLKLDSLKIKPINVPGFAGGGRADVVPGSAPTSGDNMLVVDSSGTPRATIRSNEGIIREGAMRSLDSFHPGAFEYINRHGRLPAFFNGGRMPTVGGAVNPHGMPYYGARYAADMPRPQGSPVYAWNDGTVAQVMSANTSYGNRIRINHGALGQTLYAHLSRFLVAVGQKVTAGQEIAKSGGARGVPGSGNSTGPHLHFEISGGNAPIDPNATGSSGSGLFSMAAQWIGEKLSAPVKAMIEKIPGQGLFVDAAKGMGNMLLDEAMKKITGLVPAGSDPGMSGATAGANWQQNANLLMQAGKALGADRHAMKIALMTAAQESSMGTNRTAMTRPNGDGDTGWFQQRVTRGDGTQAQLMDPQYSLGVFLHGKRVPAGYHVPGLYNKNWRGMGLGQAAQAVQVSAFPGAYDKWASQAEQWLTAFGYDSGGWLMPGLTMTKNDTGKPEAVLTSDQWERLFTALEDLANSGGDGGGDIVINVDGREIRRVARDEFRTQNRNRVGV